MLRKLLAYTAGAFVTQTITGLLSYFAELSVADALSKEEFGAYRHFLLVYSLAAGPFVVGADHALVTFVNRRAENYAPFVRLLLSYALALTLAFAVAASILRSHVEASTAWALAVTGPFVFGQLGYILFRARLRLRYEFALLLGQSLVWSLGSLVLIRFYRHELLPIALASASFLIVALVMAAIFRRDATAGGAALLTFRPFAPDYEDFWRSYRPLWFAGIAFLANTQIVGLLIDRKLGKAELAMWGLVNSMMLFIQKPVQMVQRAALPVFSSEKGDILHGFRQLVRLNLLVFPLLAIAVLGAYPLVLRFGTLSKYADTWPYLAVVIGASPVMAVEFLVAAVSMAMHLPRQNRNAHVLAAIVNVPLSWFLVARFGLWGAAAATAGYTLIFGALMFWFTRRELAPFVAFAAKMLAGAIVVLMASILVLAFAPDRTLYAPIAAAVYIAGSYVVGVWRPDHIAWAVRAIRRTS